MKKLAYSIAVLFAATTTHAQHEDSVFLRRLADEILVNSQAYENLRHLTKQIGGRLAGSPQMVKAEQWGLGAMKAANAENAWLQECMVPHWVRGGKDIATAKAAAAKGEKAFQKSLDIIALGNSVGSMKPMQASVIEINSF